jgi:5'-methylthioadenosine phosphorylase
MSTKPALGVIGGSGLYAMEGLENIERREVETPFGEPSSPIILGDLNGKQVAFLARHGMGHIHAPSEVNYRANIYALKSLGVERVVSVSACGSLREDYEPGDIVVPDQIYDRTRGRENTFFERGFVAHISVADPFCPDLSSYIIESVADQGGTAHDGGAYVIIPGPRFSTRAESNTYRAWGMSIVGMTTAPEAFLAREAEMCYAVMAHVTDYDVWHSAEEPVTVEMVFRTIKANTLLAQQTIARLVERLPEERTCYCGEALKDALTTDPSHIPAETRERLSIFVDRYLE